MEKSGSRGRPPRKAQPFMAPTSASKSKNQEMKKKLNAKLNRSIGFGTSFAFQGGANQSSVLTNVTMESQRGPRASTRAASHRASQDWRGSMGHTRNGTGVSLKRQRSLDMPAAEALGSLARSQTLKRKDP